jgi:hypothetical protein
MKLPISQFSPLPCNVSLLGPKVLFSGLLSASHKSNIKKVTLILLTWRIWWAPNNASKWQMGFNLASKGLKCIALFRFFFIFILPPRNVFYVQVCCAVSIGSFLPPFRHSTSVLFLWVMMSTISSSTSWLQKTGTDTMSRNVANYQPINPAQHSRTSKPSHVQQLTSEISTSDMWHASLRDLATIGSLSTGSSNDR